MILSLYLSTVFCYLLVTFIVIKQVSFNYTRSVILCSIRRRSIAWVRYIFSKSRISISSEIERYGGLMPGEKFALIVLHPKAQTIRSVERLLNQFRLNSYQRFVIVNLSTDWDGDLKDMVLGNSELVLVRGNEGYDFGAWKAAINEILSDSRLKPKILILVNDSVYWLPRSEMLLSDILSSPISSDWSSLTFSGEVTPHAQSFFQIFTTNAIQSKVYRQFWDRYLPQTNRSATIHRGEINFSAKLQDQGFMCKSYFEIGTLQAFLEEHQTLLRCEFPICISLDTSPGSKIRVTPELKELILRCFYHHNPSHHFAVILTKYFGFPAKIDLASQLTTDGLSEILLSPEVISMDEKYDLHRLFKC